MTSTWSTFGQHVFLHLPSVDCGGMCSRLCLGFSRCARLTAGFLRGADVAARSPTAACRRAILAGTGGSKAAFFCLLFFAAAKKSRCCPAQGRRMNTDMKSRMPAHRKAKKQKNRIATSVADKKLQHS